MELRPARNHRGHKRRANAAAHVPHEVYDAGDCIILLWRNSHVGGKTDWYEQEAQSYYLSYAQPRGRRKTQLQVDSPGGVKHGNRQCEPAKGDQPARMDFPG